MKFSILILLTLTTLLTAREPQVIIQETDFLKVEKNEDGAKLLTANTTYSKDGIQVTLIGAVHIADKAYYQALNEEFKSYQSVLYEMIGGEHMAEHQKEMVGKKEDHALSRIYAKVAGFLKLSDQKIEIDYSAKNFVHGDLTLAEFQALQKERGESLLGFVFKAGMETKNEQQGSFAKLMKGLLTGNANLVKLELIGSLGQGDDQIGSLSGESVIITDRNAKCLKVLQKEISIGHKKCAIFYGAAHYPDMEKSLLKLGYKVIGQTWFTAWDVPKK